MRIKRPPYHRTAEESEERRGRRTQDFFENTYGEWYEQRQREIEEIERECDRLAEIEEHTYLPSPAALHACREQAQAALHTLAEIDAEWERSRPAHLERMLIDFAAAPLRTRVHKLETKAGQYRQRSEKRQQLAGKIKKKRKKIARLEGLERRVD